MVWEAWITAGVLYILFIAWYFNWRRPITAEQIESYMETFSATEGSRYTEPEVFRRFLEEDDGKEFVMLNLVRLHEQDIEHPITGEKQSPQALIQSYFKPFVKALIKRGGHPVYRAVKKGGYIDSWKAAPDDDYRVVAMMRYRSRRDLLELVMDSRFADGHIYKIAAIEKTISFPTQIIFSTYLRPAKWVLLLLLLIASVAQNVVIFI